MEGRDNELEGIWKEGVMSWKGYGRKGNELEGIWKEGTVP
jgi:hypothetical protein